MRSGECRQAGYSLTDLAPSRSKRLIQALKVIEAGGANDDIQSGWHHNREMIGPNVP